MPDIPPDSKSCRVFSSKKVGGQGFLTHEESMSINVDQCQSMSINFGKNSGSTSAFCQGVKYFESEWINNILNASINQEINKHLNKQTNQSIDISVNN